MFVTSRFCLSLLAIAASLLSSRTEAFSTTVDLKRACEQAPDGVVQIGEAVQITGGVRPPLFETVRSGCTLRLSPTASIEFSQVGLRFRGPLRIEADAVAGATVKLVESQLQAGRVDVLLPGLDSSLLLDRSTLRARGGNLSVEMGEKGQITIHESLSSSIPSLESRRSVRLSGGADAVVVLDGATISAPTGFGTILTGDRSAMLVGRSSVESSTGGITVSGTGLDQRLTITDSQLRPAERLSLRLRGEKSAVQIERLDVPPASAAFPVVIRIEGRETSIELKESVIEGAGRMDLAASLSTSAGVLKIEGSRLLGAGALSLATGEVGLTEIKGSRLESLEAIAVRSGVGGSCVDIDNVYLAPALEICQ